MYKPIFILDKKFTHPYYLTPTYKPAIPLTILKGYVLLLNQETISPSC